MAQPALIYPHVAVRREGPRVGLSKLALNHVSTGAKGYEKVLVEESHSQRSKQGQDESEKQEDARNRSSHLSVASVRLFKSPVPYSRQSRFWRGRGRQPGEPRIVVRGRRRGSGEFKEPGFRLSPE